MPARACGPMNLAVHAKMLSTRLRRAEDTAASSSPTSIILSSEERMMVPTCGGEGVQGVVLPWPVPQGACPSPTSILLIKEGGAMAQACGC